MFHNQYLKAFLVHLQIIHFYLLLSCYKLLLKYLVQKVLFFQHICYILYEFLQNLMLLHLILVLYIYFLLLNYFLAFSHKLLYRFFQTYQYNKDLFLFLLFLYHSFLLQVLLVYLEPYGMALLCELYHL